MAGKMKFTSKLTMSQSGLQTILIHILPNISQIKAMNHTMKFGQLIEHNNEILFFKNYAENEPV